MKPTPQAGAIATRRNAGHREFLLVRAKQAPGEWIFPKGHVEAGEEAPDTAIRELKEESGYEGSVVRPVGSLEFAHGSRRMRVAYFLVETGDRTGPGDGRDHRWLPYEAARSSLSHADARLLLDRAAGLLAEAER